MKNRNLHIGSIIEQKVKEKDIKISDFAKAIHCNRGNVYSLFQRKTLSIELLILISKALDFDFLELYIESDKEEENRKKYVVILEVDQSKLQQLSSDESMKIIKSWIITE